MPDFIREYVYRRSLIIAFICLPFAGTFHAQKGLQLAEEWIEKGEFSKAERQLQHISQSKKRTLLERYTVCKLLQKIYVNQQSFNAYFQQINKAEKIAKYLHPIYLAEVYAHKAYYWHYMMWSDSAKVYAAKSFRTFSANRKQMKKIEVPFIYEIHAISFLYDNDSTPPKSYLNLAIGEAKQKQFQWFDSALYYEQKFPFQFSIDRSKLYRSYANRWLDVVVDNKLKYGEKNTKKSKLQRVAFDRANQLYDLALKRLKPWHLNDHFAIVGLKGLTFSEAGRRELANSMFRKTLNKFSKSELMNRSKIAYSPLMVLMTFKVRNELNIPYDKKEIDQDIQLLEELKHEFWKSFGEENDLPYDPYSISPYTNLFSLYILKYKHERHNQAHLSRAVSHLLTLKCHFYFLKTRNELNPSELPWFDVQVIQRKLKKNECYLFKYNDNDFFENNKVLITRDTLLLIGSNVRSLLSDIPLEDLPLSRIKRLGFIEYEKHFADVHRVLPKVKKVYISYDDLTPYELFLPNAADKSFRKANFLGLSINFVRLYNPYTYFNPTDPERISTVDARYLKQKGNSRLLFMQDFFENFNAGMSFTNLAYEGNLVELLGQKGILHLYGHGELILDEEAGNKNFQLNYLLSSKEHEQRNLPGEFDVQRSLVVLNNCFSGFPFFNQNEFNKTISLRILSNGAGGVISSPDKVDDYFSAEFFKEFYRLIDQGLAYEDAFFVARKSFFINHPSLRHPQYWNALQLIQQSKLKNLNRSNAQVYLLWCAIIVFVDVLVMLVYANWQMKSIPHQHSSLRA